MTICGFRSKTKIPFAEEKGPACHAGRGKIVRGKNQFKVPLSEKGQDAPSFQKTRCAEEKWNKRLGGRSRGVG